MAERRDYLPALEYWQQNEPRPQRPVFRLRLLLLGGLKGRNATPQAEGSPWRGKAERAAASLAVALGRRNP
jgi:hypothetical protein